MEGAVTFAAPISTCLECPLFRCDLETKRKTCRFVQITVDEHIDQGREKLRRQKREHNARVRAERRAELPELRQAFGLLLNEYGTYGKHSQLMRMVRAEKN